MAKIDAIEHEGIVLQSDGSKLLVEILSSSACAGCHALAMCSASETKKKEVEVYLSSNSENYSIGDHVTIVGSEHMGNVAVLIAYVAPLILMLLVLVVGKAAGLADGWAGVLSVVILAPYFLALYILRDKLHKTFIFKTKNQLI